MVPTPTAQWSEAEHSNVSASACPTPSATDQVIPPLPSLFTLLRPYLAHLFPVFSRFLRVFTAWPRRFQRAPSRNPGPRNSGKGTKSGELRPSFDTPDANPRINWQVFADWATHIVRLTKDSPYIEVEWTAGPIPMTTPPPPPPGPGPTPRHRNLTDTWTTAQDSTSTYALVEKEGGAFTVASSDPGHTGWHTATGHHAGTHVTIRFDNGFEDHGSLDSDYTNVQWVHGGLWTRKGAKPDPGAGHEGAGKEVVLQFNSQLRSGGTFFTDSNGREMIKRQRNARGPSYPPYQTFEPIAANYYPVNSLMSLDDGKTEMSVVVDTTMGGSSIRDGSLEVMVHRRCQKDDSRGVQEPLNETMCGCNDIGAAPGNMGAHGHEGDGGCDCQGLTMRGSTYLIVDTVENSHATRRQLIEQLNFPPTLAFTAGALKTPTMTAIEGQLPPNIKLQTITGNYKDWNNGQLILRLAHKYQVDEHPTLSLPANVSLASVFSKAGLKITSASETMLTANQPRREPRLTWPSAEVVDRGVSANPQERRAFLDENDASMTVTLNAMEVKTFLVTLA